MDAPNFKTMLLEMSLEELNRSVLDVIRQRPDVDSVVMTVKNNPDPSSDAFQPMVLEMKDYSQTGSGK